jgi:Glycosyl hydrolase family 99
MLRIFLTVLLYLPYSGGTFDTDDFEKLLVGAYYYPWHGNDFHRGGGYIRKEIGHTPALGEYDDSTSEVIQKHLEYSRRANIKLWVTSWWGRFSREDNTTRTVILPEVNGTEHKIALLYETTGILDNEDGSRQLNRVVTDVEYILDTYVSHPNYFTVDGRPVLFVYLVSF